MSSGCKSWHEKLERYHDGELPRAEAGRVEEHLATCDGCRRQLDELQSLRQLVVLPTERALARLAPGRMDALWGQIAARLDQEREPTWREKLSVWFEEFWGTNRRVVFAAAAAACLTLAVAYPLLRGQDGAAPGGAAPGAATTPVADNEVFVDSLQSGEHDMVLVNVHPDDMTTVIWLLEEDGAAGGPPAPGSAVAPPASAPAAAPAIPSAPATAPASPDRPVQPSPGIR